MGILGLEDHREKTILRDSEPKVEKIFKKTLTLAKSWFLNKFAPGNDCWQHEVTEPDIKDRGLADIFLCKVL